MPVQFYNLGFNLSQAQNAQQSQNLFYMQERGGNEVAATQVQDQAKQEQNLQTQGAHETQNREVQGDSRGARSHLLRKKKPAIEEKKEEPPAEKIPDPSGRGRVLDIQF